MRKMKTFILSLILALTVIFVGNYVIAYWGTVIGKLDNNGNIVVKYNANVYGTDETNLEDGSGVYQNLYCVQRGQWMDGGTYSKVLTIEIHGNDTTITNTENKKLFEGTNPYSNKIAAALYLDKIYDGNENGTSIYGNADDTKKYGVTVHYSDDGNGGTYKRWFTAGQLALWELWGPWRDGLSDNVKSIIQACNGSDGETTEEKNATQDAMEVVNKYSDMYTYSATIYYLQIAGSESQRLILADALSGEPPITVQVQKIWDDNDNQDGKRPSEITVTLYANGESTGKTLKLNSGNGWKGEFTGLDKYKNGNEIVYTVDEGTVTGYTKSITGDQSSGFKITNTHVPDKTEITVQKVWDDDGDRDRKRPTSITLILKANGTQVQTVTLNNETGDTWSYTFTDLPKYSGGKEITYTVDEQTVPTGYTKTTNGLTVTNSYTPEKIKIPVEKIWDDDDNRDGKRPSEITVTLYADGESTGKTLKLNSGNGWKGEFTDLYKYKDGNEITYTVDEETVPDGYTKNITGNQSSGFTITNTHVPEVIDIPVQKVWDDDSNRDGKRPSEITVTLYADGESTGKTLKLNSGNDWKGEFTDLYKYKDGNEITYTVEESIVPEGYTKTTNGLTVTNSYTPEKINIPVEKIWNDDDNRDGKRPQSIKVTLYKNGDATNQTLTLQESNNWKGTFENLYKYENGQLIEYSIKEEIIQWYNTENKDYSNPQATAATPSSVKGSSTNTEKVKTISGFTITNKHIPERIKINVTKVWEDENDFDEYRPDSITVTLYKNGVATKETRTLNVDNNWTASFEDLYKYENGQIINYTVKENAYEDDDKYQVTYSGNTTQNPQQNSTPSTWAEYEFTITNTHTPHYEGYIEISGKVWVDNPSGKANDVNGVYGGTDKLLEGIKVTLKNSDGTDFKTNGKTYTTTTDENGSYTFKINYDESCDVYKLYGEYTLEKLKELVSTSYVEFEYDALLYTTVAPSATLTEENKSKAVENETTRNRFDSSYSTVAAGDTEYEYRDDNGDGNNEIYPRYNEDGQNRAITAVTKNNLMEASNLITNNYETLKYCYGTGPNGYIRTHPEGAWKDPEVGRNGLGCNSGKPHAIEEGKHQIDKYEIKEINLGLFIREQPDVGIFSDISKVRLEMNGQEYTYKYNIITPVTDEKAQQAYNDAYNDAKADGMSDEEAEQYATQLKIQTKFQDNETYEYRTPVNPADIAYVKTLSDEEAKNTLKVEVTYVVTIGNSSTTLPITVHKIKNYFDTEYELTEESKNAGWTLESTGTDFNTAIYNGNITVSPLSESALLELTYSVSIDAIKGLLAQNATLYNALEIEAYSTAYGEKTLYAEQRAGERANQAYGGYDFDSHPGNAGIYAEGNELKATKLEDDTDIAPSFVLCKDETPKTLSGTVFEDTDNRANEERVGDGKYDSSSEKNIQYVKAELYEKKADGTETYATVYDLSGNEITNGAIQYTNEYGNYVFEGVVTGKEYYVKYTYGDDTTVLPAATKINGVEPEVNARNYKSTIITNTIIANEIKNVTDDKLWYIKIEDNYSTAVDDMDIRNSIEDLYYNTFDQKLNMISNTPSFIVPVEFDINAEGQVEDVYGSLPGISNNLSKLDFGIIERPREDLFTQKTITNIKLTLANGQVLFEGDPREKDLNYVKAMGFKQNITTGAQARAVEEKVLLAELDAELTQGAKLEVQYEVTVTNNNEIDYISQNYYYYGEIPAGATPVEATIGFVDYMNGTVVYEQNSDWANVDVNTLHTNGLISTDAYEVVKDGYAVLQPKDDAGNVTSVILARGETSSPLTMSVKKLLTNQEENVYDNGVEIIKIDGNTARTIQEVNGEIVEKTYIPGNYIPTQETSELEQDDDRVKVVITPPTGLPTYITYTIIGLVSLIVIATGVLFIKKKVSTK